MGNVGTDTKDPTSVFYMSYEFEEPGTMTLNEEYFVISTFGFIGSIGGTLGMFVGFDFFGIWSLVLKFLKGLFSKGTGTWSCKY